MSGHCPSSQPQVLVPLGGLRGGGEMAWYGGEVSGKVSVGQWSMNWACRLEENEKMTLLLEVVEGTS